MKSAAEVKKKPLATQSTCVMYLALEQHFTFPRLTFSLQMQQTA